MNGGDCLYKMICVVWRAEAAVHDRDLGVHLAAGTSCPGVDGNKGRS